jgi:hypothetical protein
MSALLDAFALFVVTISAQAYNPPLDCYVGFRDREYAQAQEFRALIEDVPGTAVGGVRGSPKGGRPNVYVPVSSAASLHEAELQRFEARLEALAQPLGGVVGQCVQMSIFN